ncbi:MAG TPA: transposase [bacterium]|nr:transposase [bacterium]
MTKRTITGGGNTHFVTFGCAGRRQLLNTPRSRQIVISVLSGLSRQGRVSVSGFVIMPDHVHALLWFKQGDSVLAEVMKTWKRLSAHYLIKYYEQHSPSVLPYLHITRNGRDIVSVWTRRYYDFSVRSHEKAHEKLDYMHYNPVKQGLEASPQDYIWSSARWYYLHKSVGVKIEPGF